MTKRTTKQPRLAILSAALICGMALIWAGDAAAGKVSGEIKDTAQAAAADHALGSNHLIAQHITPHKALYDIQMVARKNSSQVLNISGKMYFEWGRTCDAWTTDHRFNLTYEYADSPAMHITSDFSTYEPLDGSSLDYTSMRKRNGDLYQEIRGHADIGKKGGKATYTMPEGLVYDLDPGTLFPMTHTVDLIAKALSGKKFFSATVFDGSDEDGPVEINSFIGASVPFNTAINAATNSAADNDNLTTETYPKAVNQTLLKNKAWNIRMAFFPLNNSESKADYEMNAIFHENGIISDMKVEYDDFSVTQTLIALEALPPASCDKQAAPKNGKAAPPDRSDKPAKKEK